jgi:hypothetical protein
MRYLAVIMTLAVILTASSCSDIAEPARCFQMLPHACRPFFEV